ncbi:hypothetical protein [Streptomyces sp. NPDC005799]|uniref:hypothetical protein n=1 Tax=Streptomyces sp. NPDC005799 TaxID=3154678 RepID=UPI0033DE3169
MGAGDDLHSLRLLAVPGHRPQLNPIDADHVRERVRVASGVSGDQQPGSVEVVLPTLMGPPAAMDSTAKAAVL